MIKYCYDSIKYIGDNSYESFISEERNLVFSIFSLSQLGELVNELDNEIIEQFSDIPWNAMKSIRNRIFHDYDGIQYRIIWNILCNEVPLLTIKLKSILELITE